jgi:hypothetical protein
MKKLQECDYKKLVIALRNCDKDIQEQVIKQYKDL